MSILTAFFEALKGDPPKFRPQPELADDAATAREAAFISESVRLNREVAVLRGELKRMGYTDFWLDVMVQTAKHDRLNEVRRAS